MIDLRARYPKLPIYARWPWCASLLSQLQLHVWSPLEPLFASERPGSQAVQDGRSPHAYVLSASAPSLLYHRLKRSCRTCLQIRISRLAAAPDSRVLPPRSRRRGGSADTTSGGPNIHDRRPPVCITRPHPVGAVCAGRAQNSDVLLGSPVMCGALWPQLNASCWSSSSLAAVVLARFHRNSPILTTRPSAFNRPSRCGSPMSAPSRPGQRAGVILNPAMDS